MKVIIAGGRDFNDYEKLKSVLNHLKQPFEIVSGMAKGADSLAVRYANENGLTLHKFPADWDTHGKGAGFKRNAEMADFSDALIAFWDGKSRGTNHMIRTAEQKGLRVLVVKYIPNVKYIEH